MRLIALQISAHIAEVSPDRRYGMQKQEMDGKRGAEIFEPLLDSQQAADLMHLHPESVKRT
jgi:hypothetical protein